MAEALAERGSVTGTLGHYNLGDKVGAGAMGEVFRAHDRNLDREVAIKVLPAGLFAYPVARKHFRSEALALSKLNHPNIASFYDFDTQDGTDFLVMEFVPGLALNDKLAGQPLAAKEAVDLGIQLAAGLAAAHREGVIHRDLKPRNLRLTPDGRLKILDFGLARLLTVGDPSPDATASQTGTWAVAGTLPYMAPELLRGEPADIRSDLWAAGVVLYEMTTGQLPFPDRLTPAMADGIQHRLVLPPRVLVPDLSPRIERIILKCLEKDPQNRYQSAENLLTDLQAAQQEPTLLERAVSRLPFRGRLDRRRKVLLTVVALAILILLLQPRPNTDAMRAFEVKHIAVLPFVAVGADPSTQAFSRGLTESLTARLTQLSQKHSLQVVPQSEVRLQSVSSVEEARGLLGVNLAIEGSYQQSGSRVRVTYNVVDAATRVLLSGDTVTADAGDPFGLEDRVVSSALKALELELSAQERQQLSERGTRQPAAYDLYLRGRGYLQDYQNPENIASAMDFFRRALERDPNYDPARAGLGESYWLQFEFTHDRKWVDKAEQACRQANLSGVGHSCLGTVYNGTGKYELAAAEFRKALEADENDDGAYRGLALANDRMGNLTEAESAYRRAISVRPLYWAGHNWLGAFFYRHARYPEAIGEFTRVSELAPENVRGYNNLGGVQVALGRYAEAVPVLERSLRIQPTWDAYSNLGTAYFYLHRFADAVRDNEEAVKLDQRSRTSWGNLADAYFWAPGRRADATSAYQRAIAFGEEQFRVNSKDAALVSYLAAYHSMLREKQPALARLADALRLDPRNSEVLFNAALVANQFGDTDTAIAQLKKALAAGIPLAEVTNHPNFDNMHSDQRFQALLRENKTAGNQ